MATQIPLRPEALQNRAVIGLKGEGTMAFLHNILTCNVAMLNDGGLAYGALLSPQGKILRDMFIHHWNGEVLIDCDAAQRDDLIAKLKFYRLRAKFDIVVRDDLEVVSGAGRSPDPRHVALGARGISPKGEYGGGEAYDLARYAAGIADPVEIGSNRLFPHEANFDQFGAVDFKKGCYIGQEVVSRMQHRGTARSRILPVTLENDLPSDELRIADSLVGEILGRRGKAALALIRLDRIADSPAWKISVPQWLNRNA